MHFKPGYQNHFENEEKWSEKGTSLGNYKQMPILGSPEKQN